MFSLRGNYSAADLIDVSFFFLCSVFMNDHFIVGLVIISYISTKMRILEEQIMRRNLCYENELESVISPSCSLMK